MKINEYINTSKDKAKARRELALAVGKKEVTIRSWANGHRHPGRKTWAAIEKATNGAVTTLDLIATNE